MKDRLNIRIDPALHNDAKVAAMAQRISLNQLIEKLLDQHMYEPEKPIKKKNNVEMEI